MSTLVSLSLLLVGVLCLVHGQQITPKCSDTVIAKINQSYAKNSYPTSMSVGSKKWTVIDYSVEIASPVCVKQVVGDGNVKSTLINTQTKVIAFSSIVTFTGGVQNGLIVQKVQGTGETIHLYIIKSTSVINVFYLCDPNSKDTSAPQGGVAVPIGKDTDKDTIKEAKAMVKVLAEIGVKTYAITPCKE